MKNFYLFLAFVFVSLLCASGVNMVDLSQEGEEEYVLQSEQAVDMPVACPSMGYVLPVTAELPDDGMVFEDAQSLARQLRVCGRGQRTLSVHYSVLDRGLLSKVIRSRMDALSQLSMHVYTSLPCRSWDISSDHYVFGMRHILI